MQLEVGSLLPVLSLPYRKYQHFATYSWLKNLWMCLDKYGISLRTHSNLVGLQRQNDFALMDKLVESNWFTQHE